MLQRLVEQGNTVVVIEHNLDVIKTADWLVDLGPEGGAGGGAVVAEGTPEDVAAMDSSHTGVVLRHVLPAETPKRKPAAKPKKAVTRVAARSSAPTATRAPTARRARR